MTTYDPFNKPVLLRPVESGQFTSIRYGERLDEIGARPSIVSIGDSVTSRQVVSLREAALTLLQSFTTVDRVA